MPNEKDDSGTAVRVRVASAQGLNAVEVAERIAAGKTNAFVQDTSRSVWSIVRANVLTLFNGIILACQAKPNVAITVEA